MWCFQGTYGVLALRGGEGGAGESGGERAHPTPTTSATLLFLLPLGSCRSRSRVCVEAWKVSGVTEFKSSGPLTWYGNYWWREDEGIDLEVGDVGHEGAGGGGEVAGGWLGGVQAGDEGAVARLRDDEEAEQLEMF